MTEIVGKSVTKIDALSLATGEAKFTDDFTMPRTAVVKIMYSPHAHARIVHIDTSAAEAVDGVIDILTHRNVRRILHTTAGQGAPEPSPYDAVMFEAKMRFVGDRVAAVLAEDEMTALKAISKIKVEYEILTPLFDPEKAMEPGAPVIHEEEDKYNPIGAAYHPARNIAGQIEFEFGDIGKGFKEADVVVDQTYRTGYASHCMLEPHSVFTYLDERNRLVIITSTQVPFHVRRICARLLEIPISRIRVIKPRIGGGFGSKQEVFLEYIPALFTLRTGRPAKLIYSREEVFVSSRTRHPMRIRCQSGVKNDGTITSIDYDVLMNTGAYGAHALTVLSNAGSKVLPLVNKVKNVRFRGYSVYTNLPVAGAYRGYGVTQSAFAFGQQMDIMARSIHMDVVDFYLRNHIRQGETSPIFEYLGEGKAGTAMTIESCALEQCIRRGAKIIGWNQKRSKRHRDGTRVRGLGMVALMQGSSIPDVDMGAAAMKMNEDGSFHLYVGATDIGTGSDTILAQIAAEVLSVPMEKIIVFSSDTDFTPFDTGAYASSTTYLSGEAVRKCAEEIRQQVIRVASEMSGAAASGIRLDDMKAITPQGEIGYDRICCHAMYEKNQFQIQATSSHITRKTPPPFAAHFTEVEIDEETGEIKILKYVAVVDCGTAINPALAEGQSEGAIVNGISFALTEQYLFNQQGAMLNPSFDHYKIFTAADLPDIQVILIPTFEPTGPFGAKSISEININGPAPAIANAIYDAAGVRLFEIPMTPESIYRAIGNRGK